MSIATSRQINKYFDKIPNAANKPKKKKILTTPIILKKEVIWITKSKWDKNNQEIKKILKKWKESWESLNPYTFISQHSINFQSKKHNFEKRVSHILRIMSSKSFIDVEIEDMNIFFYPDKKEIIYTDFKQNYKKSSVGGIDHVKPVGPAKKSFCADVKADWYQTKKNEK